MNALTVTLGTIGVVFSLVAWASFIGGVGKMVRAIMIGQSAPDRWRPFLPRLKTMLVEFLAHTRMNKFRTVGWAHWLVMIGFLAGFILYFEAYPQTFDPEFHWPLVGGWGIYHLMDEVLGIATVIGILVLITIRQLNHPRVPQRLSRFSGSKFGPAYTIELIVLIEGLGMVLVKAGKIATYGHANAWSDFFTMQVAKLLPSSVAMVSVFAFVKMVSGSTFLLLVGRNINWGVAWHRFAAFFNIYFKREKDGGVALGAVKPMTSGGKALLDMEEIDPDNDTLGVGRVEDFSWKGWLDFTTCTECGRCQSQCPAWNTGKPLSPKLLIMSLRDHGVAKAPYLLAGGRKDMGGDEVGLVDAEGKPNEAALAKISDAAKAEAERPLVGGADVSGIIDPEVLWSCTTCGACVEQCPVDIEHVDHIIDMRRYQVLIESEFPSELAGLFKNLENKGNPWGQNAKDRLNWMSELDFDIPVFGQDAESFDGYEYLFWVGCAGAYEDRAKRTTKAVAELLATAGVKFMVLGAEETCTGDSARRAGNEFLFQQLAMQNIETLNSVFEGVEDSKKKIVVTCAHCFNALNNEYPQVGGTYEVVHHTQLLNRLVRQQKLVRVKPVSEKVTYHDPCYLGRHNKIYNAPRELMGASGAKVTEMPRHGERSMCCGAGGARMWMEEQLGKRVNLDRTDEALAALDGGNEPSLIATGCPFCRVMLTDGVTARKDSGEVGQGVEVVDVAQLMLQSIERVEPGTLSENLKVIQQPKQPEPEPVSEPEPVAEAAAPAEPKPAPAGGGLAMKGGGKAPGGGLGMKGGGKAPGGGGLSMKGAAKAPGAKAPASEPTEDAAEAPTAKPGGLGMKGGAKAPGGKGLAMKGAAKAPGAKAEPAAESAEAEAPATPTAKPGGLGMKGGAKAPGGKGLAMKGAAKAPGAKAAPAESSAAAAETEAGEAESGSTETKPTVAAKGLAMKSGFKKPGAKAPGAKSAAAATPAAESAPAESAPAESAPAETAAETGTGSASTASTAESAPAESGPTETKPTVAPKGLAMKSGFKKPGPKAPGAPKPAPAAESAPAEPAQPEAPASSDDSAAAGKASSGDSEAAGAAAVEASSGAATSESAETTSSSGGTAAANGGNGSAVQPPTAKPGGLGFKSGAKAPGRKN
ncbi:heterodisulfide reductase-related iron-sulfur binding cluster [Nocardia blacklockiae]|uniref:heterodisulfide reductase-related iron-sulfur binding cluster n=1 Tax=Nocardia blacklockiae TaxID=480036 RepID=UPI0018957588|nr:(Fe-S)-binding protein [Nocardia blacklockiae]MBF6175507.1 (Fe-S)-binding protein [Nocardia blacklockiae]